VYGAATLTQEHLAECLKRVRQELLTGRASDGFFRLVPIPVAERTLTVRVAEPIDVGAFLAGIPDTTDAERIAKLTAEVRLRMQQTLDGLSQSLGTELRVDNVFGCA
jgi:hypothetical protein